MPKNNLPLYFEELKLKEEATLSLSDLLAQLKQQIPVNFVYLAIKEKNHQCSTTGWKEPVCERYGFEYQGDWKQIDIPHSLLAKLGLKKGVDLPTNFYLAPHLLKKEVETPQGGITLQEGEIIIVDPNKITIKDQAIQTEPREEEFKKLSEELETQQQNYLDLERLKDGEITELKKQLNDKGQELKKWTNQFPNQQTPETVQERINTLIGERNNRPNITVLDWNNDWSKRPTLASYNQIQSQLNNATNAITQKSNQLVKVKNRLAAEIGWWDNWTKSNQLDFYDEWNSSSSQYSLYWCRKSSNYRSNGLGNSIGDKYIKLFSIPYKCDDYLRGQNVWNSRIFKEAIKEDQYTHYRDYLLNTLNSSDYFIRPYLDEIDRTII